MTRDHPRLVWLSEHRCFVLLMGLLALMIGVPFVGETPYGRHVITVINMAILMAAVTAAQRTKLSIAVAIPLAVAMLVFQFTALETGAPGHFALSWGFGGVFYAYTLAHLLQYVLRRDVMTADKLYGAVAIYIMIGVFWAYTYGVVQYFYPGAFALHGTPKALITSELLFFSFVVLTSTGFGDIVPLIIQSRFLVILEALSGVMYVAILIARLTGVYPTRERGRDP